ncbi:SDR family oxidoreductase [Bacillus sp. FDAARGOS_1420]|uniref:dTDP-4-dehydrorhamnose reductase family protein n=1 Tax=unclassified Bacillus (in: firmicutes) TaxID=185979 RepID=UPI001C5AAF7E|nr:SDR family oxidoreductase [Bacillus sp. FDAARGOS_1420]MBW3496780.1 SDR family oxidoreductase [Bacillus sp. FDAARGOS_1420]
MKILILGGQGMAGHMLTGYFLNKKQYEVHYTTRDPHDSKSIYLDVIDCQKLEKIIEKLRPNIVINCVEILNEYAENNTLLALQVNSLLPHQLVKLIERHHGKLIQISTDCVFSGKKGGYIETDIPDGTLVYSKSKQLGEIINDKHLTIRTSIIGPELKEDGTGLFLWFMKQIGKVKGYKNVLWNGVTTLELARAIEEMIKQQITGLYHLGSKQKISNYSLLRLVQEVFDKNDVEIICDPAITLDRTIRSTRADFQYDIPDYKQMLITLKKWIENQNK